MQIRTHFRSRSPASPRRWHRRRCARASSLQALREKLGDRVFFRIQRDWAAEHRYGNVTTAQFIALAERDSGMSLQHFFDVWLYQPDKPTSW
jgi:aminopeptidase N